MATMTDEQHTRTSLGISVLLSMVTGRTDLSPAEIDALAPTALDIAERFIQESDRRMAQRLGQLTNFRHP
jgi:hypothetical protein